MHEASEPLSPYYPPPVSPFEPPDSPDFLGTTALESSAVSRAKYMVSFTRQRVDFHTKITSRGLPNHKMLVTVAYRYSRVLMIHLLRDRTAQSLADMAP